MAEFGRDLPSVIVDLSTTSLDELSALGEEVIAEVLGGCGDIRDETSRLWNNDEYGVPVDRPTHIATPAR
ncbi:hypothetical protein [Spirillospora sp. CA-294931]|uniref:hypothetical protein n=1 Tax=Spirillospora sp. CA-294931 TaxID=3240042 RepID=UPI003D8BBD4E